MTPTLRTRKLFGHVAAPVPDPEPEPKHDYSNLQVTITGRPAEIMKKLAAEVQKSDLNAEEGGGYGGGSASDGIEHDLHITCRWGLHFMSPSVRLKDAIREFGPIHVTFGRTGLFKNPDFDVLKVDIDSPDLHRFYKLVGRVVPVHTTHPTYSPHATLCYLKPGKGDKYAGNKALMGQKLVFNSVVFSGKNGKRITLPLVGAAGFRGR